MKPPSLRYAGDARIRELLRAHDCPTPFHAVRTRFLGNIATPRLDASPIEAIKELWGGELPEFAEIGDANDLFQNLMGFWNHLTKHQSRSKPFRFFRLPSKATHDHLLELCRTRTEEIEGFIDGLFGSDESIDLLERAVEGMEHLGEINAMLHGVLGLLENQKQSATDQERAETQRNVEDLTDIAEKEIHAVVLSCVRARRDALGQLGTSRPTMH